MNVPMLFQKAIHRAIERNPNSPAKAIEEAYSEFQSMDGFNDIVDQLVKQAISGLVYAARHVMTTQAKRDAREYGNGAKVKPVGMSVSKAYKSFYDSYFIGGKCLGDVTGNDVKELVEKQERVVRGHTVNLKLLEWIQSLGLAPDQKLRDVVDVNDAKEKFYGIEKAIDSEDEIVV